MPGEAPDRLERRRLLTVYGRKAVLEALEDPGLECRCLHLASSNRAGGILRDIVTRSRERGVPERQHSREELARISRNGRQDQGVALDVFCPRMRALESYLDALDGSEAPARILALDGVTNPQNMGMALRSATAAGLTAILYADRGNPALGPLVIKASAGTVFRAPLLRCPTIGAATEALLQRGFTLYRLRADAPQTLWEATIRDRALFVLGGETEGITDALRTLPGVDLAIPMANGVESLNVAVSAALVAFHLAGADQRER
jgi:23S rRNA (guanosine2251-2'-O)-methyltransferase